jgi:hypothetical protein
MARIRKEKVKMMFKSDFVAVLVIGGKILREVRSDLGETVVRLPFGSEYNIRLKNLNTVKAVANVEIDGRNAAQGIIVEPGKTVELKGFLEGLKVKNRFRFIQKTDEISRHRGDRIDDGIVRITYKFERVWEPVKLTPLRYDYPFIPNGGIYWSTYTQTTYNTGDSTSGQLNRTVSNTPNQIFCNSVCEPGITVKGSETNQNFVYGDVGFLEETEHAINIKLVGHDRVSGEVFKKPITTQTRIRCSTCGRKWKSRYKFCPNCSTYLS